MKNILLFLMVSMNLFGATRGIIVATNDKYAVTLVPSLYILREIHGCQLPIQVWYSGDELSPDTIENLKNIGNITFCDMAELFGGDPKNYRGYQIKGYMMGATHFDEVVLMDADVFFFQNPEVLFNHPGYLATGAFLFRDAQWQMFGDKAPSLDWYHKGKVSFYEKRRKYILQHVPTPSSYVPDDWLHYWNEDFIPSNDHKVSSEHVETGCVIMDRIRHKKAIEETVAFNDDREVFFSLFLGEKETFWLGLEKAKEPYFINPLVPYSYFTDLHFVNRRHDLVHFVDQEMFFLQKTPEYPPVNPLFISNEIEVHPTTLKNLEAYGTIPTDHEIEQFNNLTFTYHLFSKGL